MSHSAILWYCVHLHFAPSTLKATAVSGNALTYQLIYIQVKSLMFRSGAHPYWQVNNCSLQAKLSWLDVFSGRKRIPVPSNSHSEVWGGALLYLVNASMGRPAGLCLYWLCSVWPYLKCKQKNLLFKSRDLEEECKLTLVLLCLNRYFVLSLWEHWNWNRPP